MKFYLIALCATTFLYAQTPLFDGKTLAGWEIRKGEEKWWRVEDGMITGGSLTEKVPYNSFLASTKSYQNYELTLSIKLTKGEGFMNSGVQIRSTRVPNNSEMSGYQVDAGIGWWGKLYDESRRNRVVGEPVDAAAVKATAKDWEWNDYRIVCEGKRIRSWINRVPALDYTETDATIAQSGLIGFQVHGGGKLLTQFKNIMITELPATAEFKAAPEPKMTPIQNAQPKTPEEQKSAFHLPPGFEIELVAAEDPANQVGKFISVYFDQRGRMWTQTALEYPVDANENAAIADALYASKAKDKILIYNRENLFDKKIPSSGLKPDFTFADGLAIPLGILPWGDGSVCYALHGHDIVKLTDANHDNKADQSEVILTGFGVQDSHLFPHQFTRTPGGWIWMAQGAFNYSKVKRPADPLEKAIKFDQTRMAKFRPDGSEFEITSNGPCNIWGLVMDRNGESFIQEANDFGYGVMPFHEYGNYPGCSNAQWKSYAPEFPATFVKQRFGGTGLSGLCLTDQQGAYPAPYNNLMLVANPITSRINTVEMMRDQPSPEHYLTDLQFNKLGDFVTCDDPWFRPVAMTLGPDGCVYIVDWYNKIISHNEVPRAHPDRDKVRGRIWRIKHTQQQSFAVPDFTKLTDAQLLEKLQSPSLAQTTIAAQTMADRKIKLSEIKGVSSLWATAASAEQLAKTATSKDAHLRRETARSLAELKVLTPQLIVLRQDPAKNVRREAINSLGYLLSVTTDKNPIFRTLLDFDASALNSPLAPGTRGGKPILVREAYDREYERYLVRLFLERYPAELNGFFQTDEANKLPVESLLLAALALPPENGASIIAGQLGKLKRAPNAEEVLRLVQAIDQPAIQDALRAGIANAATSQTIMDALVKNKNRISPERIQLLLVDTVDQLFKGTVADVKQAIALSSAFALANSGDRLMKLAQSSPDTEIKIAALEAIAIQQNGDPTLLSNIYQKEKEAVQTAAIKALASSRKPNAASLALSYYEKLAPLTQRLILDSLCSNKEGALALVQACLGGKIDPKKLNSITIDRLQTILHDDATLKQLLTGLGSMYRPLLNFDGKEAAWIPTNITLPGAFTFEAWVKLAKGIENCDSLGGAADQLDLNFAGDAFRIYTGSHGGDVLIAKKKIIADLWTHVAATRDDKGMFKIYINGELDNADSKPAAHAIDKVNIGWSTATKGTSGQFAEYRIWNVARSADQIRANFDRSIATTTDATLLYNGSGDKGWGALNEHVSLANSVNLPPVMSVADAAVFDKKYQQYLNFAKAGGNVSEGKNLAALCMACHQFGAAGGQIGPNLSSVGAMGPEAIVRNILTPNAAIEPGYRIFRVEMKDGSLTDAFFVSEDKDAIIVRQMGAGDKRIERKDIANTQFLRQSLMPEGLLDSFTEQQSKDLFSYLMSLK